MKNIIIGLTALSAVASYAGPYTVKFEKGLNLHGEATTAVTSVEWKYEKKSNSWVKGRVSNREAKCEYNLKIKGRDLATKNSTIGEHYFGDLLMDCNVGTGKDFKTLFSRVLYLGVRDCVKSETAIDSDYCSLTAVAFRKKTDMSKENGDIISESKRKRKYYHVSSDEAKTLVNRYDLMPQGMNPALVDSYQVFKVNVGRDGDSFYVENIESNFANGILHTLRPVDGQSVIDQDSEIKSDIEGELEALYEKITLVSDEASYKAHLRVVLPKFTKLLKSVLEIISPVEFFDIENQLQEFENVLIETAKNYNPNVTNRNTFLANYGTNFSKYKNIVKYLKNTSTSVNISGNTGKPGSSSFGSGVNTFNSDYRRIQSIGNHQTRIELIKDYTINNMAQLSKGQFQSLLRLMNRDYATQRNLLILRFYRHYKYAFDQLTLFELLDYLVDPYNHGGDLEDEAVRKRILDDWKSRQ